jgi:hypothetical protein
MIRDKTAPALFPIRPMGVQEAIQKAIAKTND